jgi:YfiH family protein
VSAAHRAPLAVELGPGVEVWFSGAQLLRSDATAPEPTVTAGERERGAGVELIDGNLAHHRPHHPERLAAARDAFARTTRTDATSWQLMRQVHGGRVGVVDGTVPVGAELRDVDALVTLQTERPLVVLAADCLPVMLAGRTTIAAVHAGWRGLVSQVIASAVHAMVALGDDPSEIRAVIGPGIGPCCYEVGADVAVQVTALVPSAAASTRRGTLAIDLREAAGVQLGALGVGQVALPAVPTGHAPEGRAGDVGSTPCTSCDPGWFSHRRDPSSGRQAGLIVRSSGTAAVEVADAA